MSATLLTEGATYPRKVEAMALTVACPECEAPRSVECSTWPQSWRAHWVHHRRVRTARTSWAPWRATP